MRITGYRTLTTVQEWGRPVGDANGVFADGVVPVPIVMVDTDEGITGVGIGPHVELDSVFAAIEGEDPRGVTALYDRMLRQTFKAGHAGAVFGTIGALDTALWDIKAKAAGEPLWRLLGGRDRRVPAYASGLDIGLTDDELVSAYEVYAQHGLRAAKLKGGLDIERDRHRLTLVREVLTEAGHGTRPGLMLDVNEAWTRKQAVRHVRELERTLDLTWIEEPVRRWDAEGLAVVGRGIRASVATGENLTGLEQYPPAAGRGGRRHRPDGRGLGGHPLPAGVRPGARPRSAGQPDRQHPGRPAARRDVGAEPHGQRAAGSASRRSGCPSTCHVEDGAFVLGDSPGLGITIDEDVIRGLTRRPGTLSADGPGVRPEQAGRRLLAVADHGHAAQQRRLAPLVVDGQRRAPR